MSAPRPRPSMSTMPVRRSPVVGEKASLEALMHGIFAITMTLLILDLRLPETAPAGHLWDSLLDLGPEVAGYLFGFFYLMAVWLSLRDFCRQLTGVSTSLTLVFLVVVGLVSLTPFTVSTMAGAIGDHHDLGVAVRLLAAVAATSFAMSAGMAKLALRQGLVPATPFFAMPWPRAVLLAAGPAALGFALSYVQPWLGLAVLSTDIILSIAFTQAQDLPLETPPLDAPRPDSAP